MKGMNVTTELKWLTVLAWIFLNACAADTPERETSPQEPVELMANWSPCPEQRPEMCPQHYDPVCGYEIEPKDSDPGSESQPRTYSNGCSACANTRVVGYIPDACPED